MRKPDFFFFQANEIAVFDRLKFSWQGHLVTHTLFINVKWKLRG